MTHFTDLCNWFLAAEPEEVATIESGMLNRAVTIRYRTGEIATITMCANGTFGYPKELCEVMGNGGIVVIDHMVEVRAAGITGTPARKTYPLSGATEAGLAGWLAERERACRQAVETRDPSRSVLAPEADKGHAAALDRFADEIEDIGPSVCGIDDSVQATRVAFAAIRSARERRFVKLAEMA
jgi:predicted dehydrogenase